MVAARRLSFIAVLFFVGLALASAPALAAKKRHKSDSDICYSSHLPSQDRADCKKQIHDAKTADDRAKIRKQYQQKVKAAIAAAAANPPAAAPPAATPPAGKR